MAAEGATWVREVQLAHGVGRFNSLLATGITPR